MSAGYDAFDAATLDDLAQLLWLLRFDASQVQAEIAAQWLSERNSPAAAGARMQRFLRHLIEHPVAHMRDAIELYERLLPHCFTLSPLQAYVMRGLLPKSAGAGYELVPDVIDLQFPRDHALKLRAQFGWHFFVGTCKDRAGREYGVELMFFGGAVFPPALAREYGLSDLENQMVELQLAISVAGERHHQSMPVVAAGTSGLIRAAADPFCFALGRNCMQSQRAGELFPMRVRGRGVDHGGAQPLELEVDLLLSDARPYIAQGADGAMPALDGIGSTYYSIPGIRIDPSHSRLRIGDRLIELASGQFWFDHQWGSLGSTRSEVTLAADNIAAPEPEGWDWFEAQLTGGQQLTVFAPHRRKYQRDFYDQTGAAPPGPMQVRVGGKLVDAAGAARTIWGTLTVERWIKAERSPSPERYPPTHVWHPNQWRFQFDDLPEAISSLALIPIVEGAQSAFFASGAQIAEGAVRVHDRAGRDIGRGFAESVGYADTRRNMLRLAGLPDTDAMLELLADKAPPLGTRIGNAMYVLSHRKQLRAVLERAKGLEFFEARK